MTGDFGFRLVTQNVQLICDTPGCAHVEPLDAPSEADVGRACPLCGSCLLTAEDLRAAQAMLATIGAINEVFAPPEGTPMESGPLVSINPHAGELKITLKPDMETKDD